MSFEPRLWTRLEYEETPIWVRPGRPDWFVPNRAGDDVLRELTAGRCAPLDLVERRFLERLPRGEPRDYAGRHAHLTTDRLRELGQQQLELARGLARLTASRSSRP